MGRAAEMFFVAHVTVPCACLNSKCFPLLLLVHKPFRIDTQAIPL